MDNAQFDFRCIKNQYQLFLETGLKREGYSNSQKLMLATSSNNNGTGNPERNCQGCILFPLLFSLYVDRIFKTVVDELDNPSSKTSVSGHDVDELFRLVENREAYAVVIDNVRKTGYYIWGNIYYYFKVWVMENETVFK